MKKNLISLHTRVALHQVRNLPPPHNRTKPYSYRVQHFSTVAGRLSCLAGAEQRLWVRVREVVVAEQEQPQRALPPFEARRHG